MHELQCVLPLDELLLHQRRDRLGACVRAKTGQPPCTLGGGGGAQHRDGSGRSQGGRWHPPEL